VIGRSDGEVKYLYRTWGSGWQFRRAENPEVVRLHQQHGALALRWRWQVEAPGGAIPAAYFPRFPHDAVFAQLPPAVFPRAELRITGPGYSLRYLFRNPDDDRMIDRRTHNRTILSGEN
jgi:hypothetical protein